jgi:hypothetical protein
MLILSRRHVEIGLSPASSLAITAFITQPAY